MPELFSKDSRNPWLEKERGDVRRVILTAVLFASVVCAGIGWLIYALLTD